MIQLALTHEGHQVESVASGEEGIKAFDDGSKHDLVLVDQRLPGMPGIEVQEVLRKKSPTVKVIMITAFASIDLALDAMHMGASDFLRKPFTTDTLSMAVQAALARPNSTAEAVPIHTVCQAFTRTSINGFTFTLEIPEHPEEHKHGFSSSFKVKQAGMKSTMVTVHLEPVAQEVVRAYTDCEEPPNGDAFWQALCEEALANHLLNNASLPENNILVVDDIDACLQRWLDAVLTVDLG